MHLPTVLVLALLGAPAAAQEPDPLLAGERLWRGVIEVASASREPRGGKGREEQTETIRFTMVSNPASRRSPFGGVPLELREVTGTWSLSLDVTEGDGDQRVVRRGRGGGRLHARIEGIIDPRSGRYRLMVGVSPKRLVAKTDMWGMFQGRFTTWRTTVDRPPFLAAFDERGDTTGQKALIEGSKEFVDKNAWLPRDVTVKWRIERVDPVVRGRVVDHRGEPVAGMDVIARYTNAVRIQSKLPPLVRIGTTDDEGRFSVPASWGLWTVELAGLARDGVVVEARRVRDGVLLSPESVPELAFELKAFRLHALPRPELLGGHFLGHVGNYLAWTRERTPEARLDRALLPPAEG